MPTYCQLDPKDTVQWNFNKNWDSFTHDSKLKTYVCKMVAILSRFQYVHVNGDGFEMYLKYMKVLQSLMFLYLFLLCWVYGQVSRC